jgi:hypothetical protein
MVRQDEGHHITKILYMNSKMTTELKPDWKRHNSNERPIYLTFAASKMSNAVKPNTVVEFRDFMGRKHKVAVRNRTEMNKAMKFFGMLKAESAKINQIIASYPMSYGRIPKRFMPEVSAELKAIGLTRQAIELVLS